MVEEPVSPLGERLVFVVGSRRSGTNWLQRVLCTHPAVVGTNGESFLFSRGLVPLMTRFHHGSPASAELGSVFANRERVVEAVRSVCDVVFGDLLTLLGPAERLVDRTPENITCLDLIGEVYPEARVVHIIRDGRDVVRSLLSMQWGPNDAEQAAEEWRIAVVEGRRQGSTLRRYREVRYEQMLADPEPVITDVFKWLGLAAEPSITEAALEEAQRAFTVDPKMATIAAGKWREGLDPAALEVLERVAGDALAELGYTDAVAQHALTTLSRSDEARPASDRAPARRSRLGLRTKAAAVVGQARARLRPGHADVEWLFRDRLHVGNRLVNRFLSGLATGRMAELEAIIDDAVAVRLVTVDDEYEGRGSEARQRLLDTLGADPVLRRRQRRGHVLPSVPTTTVFLSYEGPDGASEHRVLSLTVKADRVSGVAYYQPPARGSD